MHCKTVYLLVKERIPNYMDNGGGYH